MRLHEIERFFPELHEAIGKRGATFRVTAGPPATVNAIMETERATGIALPDSYKELLRDCDGLTLAVHRSSEVFTIDNLHLFDVTTLRERSANLAQFVRWDDESSGTREPPRIFAHFADNPDPDSPLIFDRYRRAEGASTDPVVALNLYESEWIRGDWPVIASDFNEFVVRCIKSMIETDRGFSYWDTLEPWTSET